MAPLLSESDVQEYKKVDQQKMLIKAQNTLARLIALHLFSPKAKRSSGHYGRNMANVEWLVSVQSSKLYETDNDATQASLKKRWMKFSLHSCFLVWSPKHVVRDSNEEPQVVVGRALADVERRAEICVSTLRSCISQHRMGVVLVHRYREPGSQPLFQLHLAESASSIIHYFTAGEIKSKV